MIIRTAQTKNESGRILVVGLDEVASEVTPGRSVEIRCPEACACDHHRKLLATLIDVPRIVYGSGAKLQLVCPSRRSCLIRIVL